MLQSGLKTLLVLLVGCSGGAKFPEGSRSVYCTHLIDDCDQQATEECPGGYKVLHRQNWTTNLSPMMRGGSRSPAVRHSAVRIACEPVASPTARPAEITD